MKDNFTIVTDSASAEKLGKTIMVADAIAKGGNEAVKAMNAMGVVCDASALKRVMDADPEYAEFVKNYAKDAGFELGEANIDALAQFFMVINETEINRLYRGRTAAATFGVDTVGNWLTEKCVFKTRELTATSAGQYDDFSRPSYVGYKYGWDTRDTFRVEFGLEVTKREEMVASVMHRNAYKDKKEALVLKDDIWTNDVFWNGLTGRKVYGALNDPGLTGRTTNLPVGTDSKDLSDTDVSLATVIATLRTFKQNLATDLAGNGDSDTLPVKIVCPLAWQQAFTATNETMLMSGYDWLAKNWKNAKVEFKPELSGKCIVFAENVPGVGLKTFNLYRTSTLHLVGAMPTLKGREEAYSTSIAGALVACPLGVKIYEANS